MPFNPRDRRLLDVVALWEAKRRDNRLPARADFDLTDFRSVLGRIALVDVIDGGRDFRFRLYGSGIVESYRGEMTGKSVSDYRPSYFEKVAPGYRQCVATRAPYYDIVAVDDDVASRTWERVVLPLAADGRTVDMLLVCSLDIAFSAKG